jgi:integrase
MASLFNTEAKRKKLPIMEKHPLWEPIMRGKSLGYMKLASGGIWRVRLSVGGKYTTDKLGRAAIEKNDGGMDYDKAMKAAVKWFENAEGMNTNYTVRECIDDYVSHIKLHNTPDAAKRTEQRLNKHIPADMMQLRVDKLTVDRLTKWRDSMVKHDDDEAKRKSKDSANRVLNMFKAALNGAYKREIVSNPRWNKVQSFEGVSKGKPLLLTAQQITALLAACNGGFHNLCKAAVLTGARYGELIAATVADFNAKNGTLTLRTRKGRGGVVRERDAMLSDDAVTFFQQITSNSLPTAYLLTKDDGEPWGKSHQLRPWKAAIKATAKNQHKADRVPAAAVFYDLRHYYISTAMMAHIPLKLIADNCGTSIAMIDKTYGKATDEYMRDAFNSMKLISSA